MLKTLFNSTPFRHSTSAPRPSSSSRTRCCMPRPDRQNMREESEASTSRRQLLQFASTAVFVSGVTSHSPALAVQGLTAGRIPGLSAPDADGYQTYIRPEGKSGGHGVGWSEIPRYSFKVPKGWEETPVSIADLGGTEIDLRFSNREQGSLAVVVAPLLRFIDVGFNADVRIEEIGAPEKLISGFAPELFGSPLAEDDVMGQTIAKKNSLTYYRWELKPHRLVAATAYKNRMFLIAIQANGRQWRKAESDLRRVQESFDIVQA